MRIDSTSRVTGFGHETFRFEQIGEPAVSPQAQPASGMFVGGIATDNRAAGCSGPLDGQEECLIVNEYVHTW